MGLREYARSRGVSHSTIHRAIQKRVIVLDAEGRIDPVQADATWGQIRRTREVDTEKADAESRRNASAKVAAAAAKLRLAKHRFDGEQSRYVDRVDALKIGAYEAEYFLAALRAAPDVHAGHFIAMLDVDPAVGRQILARFVEVVLTEVGDLRDEALRAAEAL